MKIRNGFVSNSSSSSFVIIKDGTLDQKGHIKIKNNILNINGEYGTLEFGWERKEYKNVYSKINFAYLQTEYSLTEYDYKLKKIVKSKNGKKRLDMLEKVIKEELNVKVIKWGITTDWVSKDKISGYIDHQSNAFEGKNIEIFDSPEILKQFLFSSHSYIQGDNDNC